MFGEGVGGGGGAEGVAAPSILAKFYHQAYGVAWIKWLTKNTHVVMGGLLFL